MNRKDLIEKLEAIWMEDIRSGRGKTTLALIADLKAEEEGHPDDRLYRLAAEEKYFSEGYVEIDTNAVVSRGDDDGAYVQAWVWVEADAAEEQRA